MLHSGLVVTLDKSKIVSVLILVLVDVALRRVETSFVGRVTECLNPCFSGCCTQAYLTTPLPTTLTGLNPCFSGCCTQACRWINHYYFNLFVLILVLVDVALRPLIPKSIHKVYKVLILVLVDVALRQDYYYHLKKGNMVLILVLVDVALRHAIDRCTRTCCLCLNPCFSGCCTQARTN